MRSRIFPTGFAALVSFAAIAQLSAPAGATASQEEVLYRFAAGNDGAQPVAGLIADTAGNLYGTTSEGGGTGCGGYGCGTVFELSPQKGGGWKETVLHSFHGGTDGEYPNAPLILDPHDNLYGTTSEGGSQNCGAGTGCGTAFELSPQKHGWQETILYSFTTNAHDEAGDGIRYPQISKPDVWSPNGIALGSDNNLHGFASLGGRCDQNGHLIACYGGGFELKKSGGAWKEKVTYRAKDSLKGGPEGPPIFDAQGNLYGAAIQANYGSVFSLAPPSDKQLPREKTLYTFQGGSDGGYPAPGLVFDTGGNLYGATTGYLSLAGNVFELSPGQNGKWTESPLYTFSSSASGETPAAAPTFGTDGNLYGLTEAGGQDNFGVVYQLALQNKSWNETVLYSFAGGSDGTMPQGTILVSNGYLFGVTYSGGNGGCYNNEGCGTVFEIASQ